MKVGLVMRFGGECWVAFKKEDVSNSIPLERSPAGLAWLIFTYLMPIGTRGEDVLNAFTVYFIF